MTEYTNFIGIDIGKFTFVVATYGNKITKEYTNDSSGITSFIKDHKKDLKTALCILETTGGHEMNVLLTLCDKEIAVHRANTRHVKYFIKSLGNEAKTDILDAKALSRYGFERRDRLKVYKPASKNSLQLYQLVQRRHDLKKILVAEKNRIQGPRAEFIKKSCEKIIEAVTNEVESITAEISSLIDTDAVLKAKKQVLMTIPGIGEIISNELIVLLPELGQISRRQIAALAGVAPIANESGINNGYRKTGYGRDLVKPILFMAAMAARNSKSDLRVFYERLTGNGKEKMKALVALMRKIIVIANAKLKNFVTV